MWREYVRLHWQFPYAPDLIRQRAIVPELRSVGERIGEMLETIASGQEEKKVPRQLRSLHIHVAYRARHPSKMDNHGTSQPMSIKQVGREDSTDTIHHCSL